jgi:murein DD-endopeptidase MepM/ murein hydrolase activator NlpD
MAVQSTTFGKRQEPHTVIIARGDSVRHFTVRPWMSALAGSVVAAITLGYFAATSYLVFRDDLIGAAVARQAHMQHAYEDRISALRAQVDRITSRQLLDQQRMQNKVSELLSRQVKLSELHGRLTPLLEKVGATTPDPAPAPASKPDQRADAGAAPPGPMALAYAEASASPILELRTNPAGEPAESAADRADKLFVSLNQSLRSIESEQITKVSSLADDAYLTADQISSVLSQAGLPVDADLGKPAMGGPLVAIDKSRMFETKAKELDGALNRLDNVRKNAASLPLANPAPGRAISSTFGVRKDPFLGTPALHSGMDFSAPTGFPAKATAAGTVSKAGWNGGYGRLVEIDHGNGFSTRFAHLSRIDVTEGKKVERGDVVGVVGSSGRSTGPHMHYEVRRNGAAVDPLRFIKVGKRLGPFL